jgi:hypothetical protein
MSILSYLKSSLLMRLKISPRIEGWLEASLLLEVVTISDEEFASSIFAFSEVCMFTVIGDLPKFIALIYFFKI